MKTETSPYTSLSNPHRPADSMDRQHPSAQQQAVFQQALSLRQAGRLAEAAALCRQLLHALPHHPQILAELGVIALQQGQIAESLILLEQALQLGPEQAQGWNARGSALMQLNRHEEALQSYDKAIALQADYAEAYANRGGLRHRFGQLEAAVADFDLAIALKPGFAEAYNHRGIAIQGLNLLTLAKTSFELAIRYKADYAEAYYNLGVTQLALSQFEIALRCFERAFSINPKHAEAYLNHGNILIKLKKYQEAIKSLDQAIAIRADFAEAYNNRGVALQESKQFAAALASCEQAIALKADYAEAYCHRGNALQELTRYREALLSYDRAIALKADYASAYWNKSLIKLVHGDFAEGWRLYEWRWKMLQSPLADDARHTLWTGEQALAGKTLMIQPEQGLGDLIQFCRYAPVLSGMQARVVISAPSELASLLCTLPGDIKIVAPGQMMPEYQFFCPAMSLPYALKTTLDTIPADIPYLQPPAAKRQFWRQRLGAKTAMRIGLAWSGSATHTNNSLRSIPLALFEPVLGMAYEFHCLQKDVTEEDALTLARFPQLRLHAEAINDFSDTAALIAEMDTVISVDTAVAHLAGALGMPLYLLLPFRPDFRWLLNRKDSPWYPSAKLFRQPGFGDWPGVIAALGEELRQALNSK